MEGGTEGNFSSTFHKHFHLHKHLFQRTEQRFLRSGRWCSLLVERDVASNLANNHLQHCLTVLNSCNAPADNTTHLDSEQVTWCFTPAP